MRKAHAMGVEPMGCEDALYKESKSVNNHYGMISE